MPRPVLPSLCLAGLGALTACVDITTYEGYAPPAGPSTGGDSTGWTPTTAGPGITSGVADTTGASATGDDASTTSGGVAAPTCGNGVVEEGEACDEGLGNGDGQACTASCQRASCGDGHVQPDNQEDCDEGPLNVPVPGYQQCSEACQNGPHCGDGVIQSEHGEDCEPGQSEQENCTAACVYQARHVFLSSVTVSGALGGIAGADALCNTLVADSPTLTGTFRAWLLVDGQSLADRFPEFAGVSTWNFMNTAGEPVAKSFAMLVAMGPKAPIYYTEDGTLLPEEYVWTNISSAGQAAGGDCAQWTSTAGVGALVGLSGHYPDMGPYAELWRAKRWWTDADGYTRPCHDSFPRLYCIQVAG